METDQIQVRDFTIYNGRNIYSHRPAVKMIVDIGKYGEIPTNKIPGFNQKLLEYFPGLKTNYCGLGYEGGFLERLRTGTYLAHVLEHVILEMQYMVGYDVHFGKTRVITEPSLFYLVYEFENEICGLECGKASVFILNCILAGENIEIGEFIDYLKKVSQDAELGPSTSAIVDEARKRGIPVTRIGNGSLVRLGYGRHSRLVESTLTDSAACICVDISCNKQLTKFLLGEHQIPVPYGKVVYSEISALMVAKQIGMPVVIKPFDGNQGKGVHLNLKTDEEIKAAFREASKYSNGIIVEKYVKGCDFRILVVGGRVSAVSERRPAGVVGDGVHTIKQLVEIVNRDPNRGEQHEKPLTKIKFDTVVMNVLKKNGMAAETIPANGQPVFLRENGNLSTGGIAIDCTDRIHPENVEIAVRAASAIGIDIAGIDIVAEDISQPITETGGAVVEVNTAPGIRMHLYPSEGKPRNVARDIVDMLFPDDGSIRFPIVSVTGTNGKTTVARMVQHVMRLTGKSVGMTSTSGTYIDDKCICRGDNSGPRSARSLLSNKKIDAAVLETARGGIVREGLGYDLADIGVITNITDDHLGMAGCETLEDLAYIKSLVVEAVKKDGTAVLNAEDPMTPSILGRVKARKTLFYKDENRMQKQRFQDCSFVFVKDGLIKYETGGTATDIAKIEDIPITGGGRIPCNIDNALAATAALLALGTPIDIIQKGFASFCDNEGRFNLYDVNGVRVMLDYGHNPAGYDEVIQVCKSMKAGRLIGVIGMPGDRMDSSIKCVGKKCAGAFDRLYIKEDRDLRGRRYGEVARIFLDAVTESGFRPDSVSVIEDELEALKQAVSDAKPGDLIVELYERLEPLQIFLLDSGARRIPFQEL